MVEALLATATNRVELFAVELQEEKCRLIEALLCVAVVAAMAMMTLAMITFTIVVIFWENGRLAVLISLSLAFLTGTVLAWRFLQNRLHKNPPPFSATIGELKKDRACLKTN